MYHNISPMTIVPGLRVLAMTGAAVALLGCEGATGPSGPAGPSGPPGTGIEAGFEYIVQVDTNGDNFSDTIVVVDPVTFTIKRLGTPDVGEDSTASLNNTHKAGMLAPFHRWIGGGGDLWAFDPVTFSVVPRVAPVGQFIQANREGTVGPGQVNAKASGGGTTVPKEWQAFTARSQLTLEEAQTVDMCLLSSVAGGSGSLSKAPTDTLVHSMGYSPVGFELSPDGKIGVAGVRMGDHMLFLDTDPASPTFREPLRFVIQRTGEIKDKTNAVVARFPGIYTAAGGYAPGSLHYDRVSSGTTETDKNTYVEPCDTTMIRAANGQLWFWTVDVNGDTITGARVDTITSTSPTVVQVPVPVVDNAARNSARSGGIKTVGPWMASLLNRAGGGELLLSIEHEGENSESIFDVTDPANVFEVARYVPDLATIRAAGGGTLGTAGTVGQFTNGAVYAVNVDFTSTGGSPTPVNYIYRSVPGAGDNLSGRGTGLPPVTSAYLEKQNLTDPGPRYIINGLAGRGGTSEGNWAAVVGSGTNRIVFSDKLWILTFVAGPQGNFDIFQIVDLQTPAPWLIRENVDFPSAFGGHIGPDNRLVQVRNDDIEIIDINETPKTRKTITLYHPTTGARMRVRTISLRITQ